jgi:hypothetical protein
LLSIYVFKASFGTETNQIQGSVFQLLRNLVLELLVLVQLRHPHICAFFGTVARFEPGKEMKVSKPL